MVQTECNLLLDATREQTQVLQDLRKSGVTSGHSWAYVWNQLHFSL